MRTRKKRHCCQCGSDDSLFGLANKGAKFYVTVSLSPHQCIKSRALSLEEAERDVNELRDLMASSDTHLLTELSWLTIKASDIQCVHISSDIF